MDTIKKSVSKHRGHHRISRQIFQVYFEPNDLPSEKASNILDQLNSLNSTAELMNVIGMHAGQKVFGIRIAQKILNTKIEVGKFSNLNQFATVPGIGRKRFNVIISALEERV